MQTLTFDQANQAIQAHTENAKTVAGANSKVNQLRDKYHNDVDVVQRGRVSVQKGSSVTGVGKLRAPFVVVLNSSLSEVNIVAEHQFFYPHNAKNKYRYERCLDFAGAKLPDTKCPICKAAQQGLHNAKLPSMRLAVTVLMERIDDAGNTVTWDKKLLVAKNDSFRVFHNLLVTGEMINNGNIRGLTFRLERGTGEKTAASGEPSRKVDGSFDYSFVQEAWLQQLQASVQPQEVRSEDGKYVYKPAGWLTRAIDINNHMDILGFTDDEDLRKEFDPSYVHSFGVQAANTIPSIPQPAAMPALPVVPAPTPNTTMAVPPVQTVMPPMLNVVAPTPVAAPTNPLADLAVPPMANIVPPVPEVPALAQQRNLTPVIPPVGNGNADEVETPWDEE